MRVKEMFSCVYYHYTGCIQNQSINLPYRRSRTQGICLDIAYADFQDL